MACDQMQGYLLGKPLTADAFGALLEQQLADQGDALVAMQKAVPR